MSEQTPTAGAHDLHRVRNLRIVRGDTLTPPRELLTEVPLSDEQVGSIVTQRQAIKAILDGEDDRLFVVIGPCSVHDPDAALDYAQRLVTKASQLDRDLLIAMRVYFEKPRTTTGWKGLINDPYLDGSWHVNVGLHTARVLMRRVIALGLPVACEFLDPITPQYISDMVAWGAIGARTTESQIHRQLASGLSMPIGFKNGTTGDVSIAADAVRAAAAQHAFPGVDDQGVAATMQTAGNEDGHVILRGGRDAPNYGPDGVAAALQTLAERGLRERVIIDASHDNSGKDEAQQVQVAAAVGDQIGAGNRAIVGVMLESFIVGGRQSFSPGQPLTYGQSITDACMDWDTSVGVLEALAAAVRARRAS